MEKQKRQTDFICKATKGLHLEAIDC